MEYTQTSYEYYRDNQQVPACWRSRNDSCLPHYHNALELVYVREGTMEAILDGRHYRVERRQLLIVPGYTVHLYETPVQSDTTVLIVPSDYIPAFQVILKEKTFASLLLEDGKYTREIYHCMKALRGKAVPGIHRTTSDSHVVKGYIQVIVGTLLDCVPLQEQAAQADSGQVQKILDYLHGNFQSPLSLRQIAAEFGYSSSRFSHIFNQNVGCGLTKYINALRCRSAATLLQEHDVSVIDAAMGSGFESMRTFYRVFRQTFGVTPSEYLVQSKGRAGEKDAG